MFCVELKYSHTSGKVKYLFNELGGSLKKKKNELNRNVILNDRFKHFK